jgi:hypothetical protein
MKISNHRIHISRREELQVEKPNEHQYNDKGIERRRI